MARGQAGGKQCRVVQANATAGPLGQCRGGPCPRSFPGGRESAVRSVFAREASGWPPDPAGRPSENAVVTHFQCIRTEMRYARWDARRIDSLVEGLWSPEPPQSFNESFGVALMRSRAMRVVVVALTWVAVRMELARAACFVRAAHGIGGTNRHQSHRGGKRRHLANSLHRRHLQVIAGPSPGGAPGPSDTTTPTQTFVQLTCGRGPDVPSATAPPGGLAEGAKRW